MVKRFIIGFIVFFTSASADAQIDCFVRTQLDRRDVYAQQPFKVTFTVLTATWYTAPLEFDNIQIPNAFVIPFDRTQSGMFSVGGKQYPGLQFYFIIFPYVPGNYTIPPIRIIATTPAVGDSKPLKVTLTTGSQAFVVKSEPAAFREGKWFVAKDVSIRQYWNKPLRNLKVGDVLQRTISIDARGTLPQFIPALKKDDLDWAGIYTEEPRLTDTRDQYDAGGRLTQTFTYLLEKEGAFSFPDEQIKWWNPYSSKVYARSLPGVLIQVAANPHLGILTTLKDSLQGAKPVGKSGKDSVKGPLLIYGVPWYWFVLYVLAALLVVYTSWRLTTRAYRSMLAAREAWRSSEIHWFRKLLRSPKDLPVFLRNLYAWWDRWRGGTRSPSITAEARAADADDLQQELGVYFKNRYGKPEGATTTAAASINATRFFLRDIKKFRKQHKNDRTKNHYLCDTIF